MGAENLLVVAMVAMVVMVVTVVTVVAVAEVPVVLHHLVVEDQTVPRLLHLVQQGILSLVVHLVEVVKIRPIQGQVQGMEVIGEVEE